MILRRITEHVKAQNWFAVGLDFVIVVRRSRLNWESPDPPTREQTVRARFDIDALKEFVGEKAFARGEACWRDGLVTIIDIDGKRVRAEVSGTENYRTIVTGQGRGIGGECSLTPASPFGGQISPRPWGVLKLGEFCLEHGPAGEGRHMAWGAEEEKRAHRAGGYSAQGGPEPAMNRAMMASWKPPPPSSPPSISSGSLSSPCRAR